MRQRKQERSLTDIQNGLADFGLMMPDIWQTTLSWYDIWLQSNYVAWPFEGGSANQPAWVIHDFGVFGLIDQWIEFDRPTLDESRATYGDVMDN